MKISIITATFNSAETVRDTLESVLRQDYYNYELIIKDGGSTDGTLDICRSYVPRFQEVSERNGGDVSLRIISRPDKGMYDAMNQGIACATGEVVGILNSDDFYTSFDILKAIARRFDQMPDIDAVYGDIHYVSSKDTTLLVRYYSSHFFKRGWMRMGFMPAHPSFYCRKSTYERFKLDGSQIEGFEGDVDCAYFNTTYKIAADFEILLRMIFVNRIKTHYVYRDFVTMRIGGASTSGASSHKQINKDHRRAFKEHGIYSNYLLLSMRYAYRCVELMLGWVRR
ncbi:MAG: glycosyltransferase [Bacteroidales bacterium]|nr:glycosyltransferase [Candidatus Physcousia equi]